MFGVSSLPEETRPDDISRDPLSMQPGGNPIATEEKLHSFWQHVQIPKCMFIWQKLGPILRDHKYATDIFVTLIL